MRQFWLWCRKYISLGSLAVVGVLVYIIFFQDNNAGRIYQYQQTIDSLKMAIAENNDSMARYRDLNQRLDDCDPATIERIVRENHNMNLPNEDVYIFK